MCKEEDEEGSVERGGSFATRIRGADVFKGRPGLRPASVSFAEKAGRMSGLVKISTPLLLCIRWGTVSGYPQ